MIERFIKKVKNKETIELTIIILIILSAIVFIIILITNSLSTNGIKIETINEWEEAVKNVENNKVGIEFNSIDTDEEAYRKLKEVANKNYLIVKENNIETTVKIESDIYVDNYSSNASNINENSSIKEANTIYMNDCILSSYIDNNGNMYNVFAVYSNNKEIVVFENSIGDYYKELELTELDYKNTQYYSEGKYINSLKEILIYLYTNDTSKENRIEEIGEQFFTSNGLEMIASSVEGRYKDVEIRFIQTGRSDIDSYIKDRVYVQMLLNNKVYRDIVLKLNQNNRVYDIDILS